MDPDNKANNPISINPEIREATSQLKQQHQIHLIDSTLGKLKVT